MATARTRPHRDQAAVGGDSIANGADDDGSEDHGAARARARVQQVPASRSVLFVGTWGGEGLLGRRFVENPRCAHSIVAQLTPLPRPQRRRPVHRGHRGGPKQQIGASGDRRIGDARWRGLRLQRDGTRHAPRADHFRSDNQLRRKGVQSCSSHRAADDYNKVSYEPSRSITRSSRTDGGCQIGARSPTRERPRGRAHGRQGTDLARQRAAGVVGNGGPRSTAGPRLVWGAALGGDPGHGRRAGGVARRCGSSEV